MPSEGPYPADLEVRLARERAILNTILNERIVPLLVERRLLVDADPRLAHLPPAIPCPFIPGPAADPGLAPAPEFGGGRLAGWLRQSPRWKCGRVAMGMLEAADGLTQAELDAAMASWGHPPEMAAATRDSLVRLDAARADPDTGLWHATAAYRTGIAPGTAIPLSADDLGPLSAASPPPPADMARAGDDVP